MYFLIALLGLGGYVWWKSTSEDGGAASTNGWRPMMNPNQVDGSTLDSFAQYLNPSIPETERVQNFGLTHDALGGGGPEGMLAQGIVDSVAIDAGTGKRIWKVRYTRNGTTVPTKAAPPGKGAVFTLTDANFYAA